MAPSRLFVESRFCLNLQRLLFHLVALALDRFLGEPVAVELEIVEPPPLCLVMRQLIKWLSSLMDAQMVALSASEEGQKLLAQLQHLVRREVALNASLERIHGAVAHIAMQRPLPSPATPDYCVGLLKL
jgi:hypothetical protein